MAAAGFDAPPRRFYKTVDTAPEGLGYCVRLDGRVPKSPKRAPLVLPTPALAALIAAEWDAQAEVIQLAQMHATRRAFTAIDQIPPARQAVADEIARYAGSDVLCYLAEAPTGLVERQRQAWTPALDWAHAELGLRLDQTAGIIHCAQSPEVLARAATLALEADDMTLTALAEACALFGSAVLAFAVARGHLYAKTALDLSRLDEIFQIEAWGMDAEAAERIANYEIQAQNLEDWFSALRQV
jgi:chaperone required for assembly of F1-ATPase